MHRARHSGAVLSTLRRPRVLILLVVAGVGLVTALWLPMRNDSASATENGHDRRQAQGQHRDGWRDRNHDRDRRRDRHRDRDSDRGHDRSASRSAAPSQQPPPSRETPAATKWKPFSILTAGRLVSYGKVVYRVRETHTSLPGWEPPKLPELFKVV